MNHTAADVAVALSRSGLRDVACEYSVQNQIARAALTDAGISYEREVDRPPKSTGRVALGCSVLALGAVAAAFIAWGAWRLAVHLWG